MPEFLFVGAKDKMEMQRYRKDEIKGLWIADWLRSVN
jgi:hypothetical protein